MPEVHIYLHSRTTDSGTSEGAKKAAQTRKQRAGRVTPVKSNLSAQGNKSNFVNHPLHNMLINQGYKHHSTSQVRDPDNSAYEHHIYKHANNPENRVSITSHHPSNWEGTKNPAYIREAKGTGSESLAKYLAKK